MSKTLVEMAADLVKSQCTTTSMNTEEVTAALQNTFKALQDLQVIEARASQIAGVVEGGTAVGELTGAGLAVNPDKSIQRNKIICLECSQEFRMLSPKHLRSHGLTGKEYRLKWGFSKRQPLCARSLSEQRKKAGKARGLPENLQKVIAQRQKKGKKTSSK